MSQEATTLPIEAPAPDQRAYVRRRAASHPVALGRLVEKVGIVEAAKRIGVSASGIQQALDKRATSKTTEVAAQGVLRELGEPRPATHSLMVLRVDAEQKDFIETIMRKMNVPIVFRDGEVAA